MNNNFTKLMLAALLTGGSIGAGAQQLAFPDAAGWGRFAKGARASLASAKVYHVTNLKDSGTGSLRDAISQPNRIIVFDVAGVININSRLIFSKNLYVAGQTAPGEGVTVYGDGVSFSAADNIIVRYMRFRMGHKGTSGKDAAGIANGQNMIFDHCSFSWGQDETFSINPDGKGSLPQNITISNSIMGQGLMPHSAGGLIQSDYITLYRNLYCDNSTRNNKVKGISQFVNNVVYNWSNAAYNMGGDSSGDSFCNIESNLFINGPSKGGNAFSGGGGDGVFSFYGNDNWQDNNMNGVFDPFEVTNYSAGNRVDTPYEYPELPKFEGKSLLETLIPTVGASIPYRDPSDCYMIDEVNSVGKKGALISNEETLPYGAPNTWKVWGGNTRVDTDGDGMPDAWETANGTDPNKDDALTLAANGYTNIENYINSITVDDRDYFLRAPMCVEFVSATTSTIKMQWSDFTYGEDGFAIEIQKLGDTEWKEVARTEANVTSYTLTGLPDGVQYLVRLRAFAGDKYSDYSSEVSMATRPVEVGIIDIDSYQPDLTWDNAATTWDLAAKSWNKGTDAFADGKKVLFDGAANTEVALNEVTVSPEAVVAKGDADVTIAGTGAIGGEGSVNKGGEGTLALNTVNKYTGATVLHNGTLAFNTLKNGGVESSLGASTNFAQNWVFDGGVYKYTGASTSTDRAAQIKNETEFNVATKGSIVTMNGTFEGDGALAFNGEGQVNIGTTKFFGYKGATILRGGTVYLSTTDISKAGIGSSSKLVMAGGHLKTKGETSGYETYSFPMEMKAGTVSQFSPNRCCYWKSTLTGSGTLQLNIPYLREYIQGNYSEFTGRLVANGISSEKEGSLLLFNKGINMPKTVVEATGNARLAGWDTDASISIGGLSGTSKTILSGSSKKTKNFSCTWTIGGANTDETFDGKINNWSAGGSGYKGKTKIIKTGTGYWRLTGSNDFAGGTVVNGGNLIVNGTNSGTGNVTVNNGGMLSGKGSIAGTVKICNGAVLQAGDVEDEDYGTKLTLKGDLTVATGGKVSVQTDYITCNTIVATNPTLEDGAVIQIGEGESDSSLSAGKSFQVFSTGATLKGEVKIIPAVPYKGCSWDTSSLATEGVLKVIDPTGISHIEGAAGLKNVQYFDVNGKRVDGASAGATILRGTDANGKTVVRKVMK